MGLALQLPETQRKEIARGLYEVTEEDSKRSELMGLCPIHGETNASFSYNYAKDRYHCLSCSASGDLIKLWVKVKGLEKKTGFKTFCEQYGIEKATPNSKTPAKKTSTPKKSLEPIWQAMAPLPDNWIRKLETDRGWRQETINRLDIRLQNQWLDPKTGEIRQITKPDRVAIPIRDTDGTLCNIRLYGPGRKIRKILSWGKGFGEARLFPPLPSSASGPVLLTEGEADTICGISHGFDCITQTSKTKYWKTEHREPFSGRDVIICYDADQAGQKHAETAAFNLHGTAKNLRLLGWPDYMGRRANGSWPEDHGQDLTDFFVKHGKPARALEALFATARPYEPPVDKPTATCIMQFFSQNVSGRMVFKPRLLAERILSDVSLLYEPGTGLLYRWNGKHWELFSDDHVRGMCLNYLGEESRKSWVEDTTYQIKILSAVPHGREVNDQDDWVCVLNGMINLKTLELADHRKDFLATYSLGVDFAPKQSDRCARWLSFLQQTVQTPDAIQQLQEFAGYCLTRDTKFAKCLLLLGPGSDGKSIFIKTLRKLVGVANCSSVSFQDLENQFLRASLYNKLLNTSTEVGSRALESPFFKAIVTGDPIEAAFKHRDSFSFSPFCKLAFAANKLPRVLDNSDGFFRRLLPVSFKRQFMEDDPDYDPDLEETLEKELSGIFEWALVGLHRLWKQRRFTDCLETRELLMDYRRLNNPVLAFVEDRCVLGVSCQVHKDEIYKVYRSYCGENGFQPMTSENFFRELYAAINSVKQYRPRNRKGRREYWLKGIEVAMEVLDG